MDTIATVHALLTMGAAAVSAGLGALWPRVAYRLAVPTGSAAIDACGCCLRRFPSGWRGWLSAGSRCPACRAQIAVAWWAVSGVAGAAAAALAWRLPTAHPGQVVVLLAWLIFVHAGVLLSLVDVAAHRLPTPVISGTAVADALLIGCGSLLAHRPWSILTAVAAAAVLGGVYLVLALVLPTQLGMGDVRLAALTGLILGAGGWAAVALGSVLPYLLGLPFNVAALKRSGPSRPRLVPFGPFLVAGAVITAVIAP